MSYEILVTGAAGFLGTNLSKNLLNEGHHVTGIDNLYTGLPVNLKTLEQDKNFEFIKGDIIDPETFKHLTKRFDQIYNLACPASPPHYQKDPVYTWKVSTFGTYNALEFARRQDARFFQSSTSEVYGDPEVHPQAESYVGHVNPLGPRACYDEGKRAAESLIMDYRRTYNLDTRIIRIFNTYGPHMDPQDGRVVSNFICQALRGEPITIYGDGAQTRSFCYVDDLVSGFIKLMNDENNDGQPVNIGNPDEFTIRELADMVIDITSRKSSLSYKPLPADDPKRRRPDITRAKETLGWTPTVALREGLEKTIPWFQKTLSL